jgi:hypothetical protein
MTSNGDGSYTGTVPQAPAQPADFQLTTVTGDYLMQLVPTVGTDRETTVEGSLRINHLLGGSAQAPSGWPSYLTFAPDEVQDHTLKSVDVTFSLPDRHLWLVIGNKGDQWTDAGVILYVFAASDSLLSGRWVDGGLTVFGGPHGPHPQGWFCLVRKSGR